MVNLVILIYVLDNRIGGICMRKHDLVVTTIAVTATMLMSAVGYTNVDKYNLGTIQVKAESVQDVNDTVPEDVDKTPKWTSSFSITYVREGDALTEKVLGLDASYHLVNEPYVCNQVGTFDLTFLAYDDTMENYGLIRGRVVVEKSKTYTQPPQTTEPPLTEDDKKVLDFISKGTIELEVEAGHPNITFKSLGLEETDRFRYEYSNVEELISDAATFDMDGKEVLRLNALKEKTLDYLSEVN